MKGSLTKAGRSINGYRWLPLATAGAATQHWGTHSPHTNATLGTPIWATPQSGLSLLALEREEDSLQDNDVTTATTCGEMVR